MNIKYRKETIRLALPRPSNPNLKIKVSLSAQDVEDSEKLYNRRSGMRNSGDCVRDIKGTKKFDFIDEDGKKEVDNEKKMV